MTKGLFFPADMKKHEELSNLKVLRSAAKSIVLLTKTRYLAELRKLRDAQKAEKDKAVDDTEDRGYAEGERTYERQVQVTKDIFFQCGWKAAVEKLGLGPNAEMFQSPPVAFIPPYMQVYASAVQKRLIEEAKKAAKEEAAAAQPAEQIVAEASEGAEDE
ncbi:hypothetical protein CsSME_00030759 [Camellia sinensis var. sinensis]